MKSLFFTAAIIAASLTAQAQVERDAAGNFYAAPKAAHDSTTAHTYTDAEGISEPVYKGSRGGYYLARTSKKSGKYYRKYLKAEGRKTSAR